MNLTRHRLTIQQISRTFVLFILLSCVHFSFAQVNRVPNLKFHDAEPYFFGFNLSVNQMDFTIEPLENYQQIYFKGKQLPQRDLPVYPVDSASILGIESIPTLGFTVSIIGDLRLGKYFNFRFIPSLAFGSRILHYELRAYRDTDTINFPSDQKVSSTFIELPFLLKFRSARVHNMRAYVTGGIKYSFDLASQANKEEEDNYEPKLFRSDSYLVGGAGLDFFMNWFKFGVEMTMSYGLRDMLLRENNIYTDGIGSLRSKIFMLTFTFEG